METTVKSAANGEKHVFEMTDEEILRKHGHMKLVCPPSRLAKVMKLLSPQHVEKIISDTGLGYLNMIREFKLRRIMLIRLAKSFDSETSSITIGKTPIPITAEDMHHIFGLAIEGEDIDRKLESAPDPNLFNTFQKNGSIDLADLETEILSSKTPDNDFLARFVLFTIGTVSAPTTKSYVDAKYLKLVADIKSLPRLNWGCFTMKMYCLLGLNRFGNQIEKKMHSPLHYMEIMKQIEKVCTVKQNQIMGCTIEEQSIVVTGVLLI
uniref:Aminotransferase-like plant mobile domain-containing protein n=1 Tax=Aegilops tauschii TaxID=37682 RepID=M8BX43_AEGTA